VRTLLEAGVAHVFTLYGGHLEAIFQACREHRLALTDVRHEVAAGHAAEGYARAKRTLGVCLVTAGPGFTNVVSSIANAFLDRTPLLYLCSSAPLAATEINMVQSGFDQAAVARPITKWAHRVTLPADIPRLVAQAIRIATAEPCGPVLLDIPSDVLFAPVDPLAAPIPKALRTEPPQPAAPAVDAALSLLASARRPVILVGDGAYMACAEAELREFVDATGIPVYSDYFAHGLLPASHPLYGGTFFKLLELDDPGARPDVVLALGTRFGVFTFGRGDRVIPFDARVIHVDVDAREIGRLRDADVSMVANAREVLRALNRERATKPWRDLAGWRARIEEKKVSRSRRFAETLLRSDPPIHPYQAVTTAVDTVGADAIFVGDGAHAHHWLAEAIRCEQPGGFVTHGLFADAGLGLGLAIGRRGLHHRRIRHHGATPTADRRRGSEQSKLGCHQALPDHGLGPWPEHRGRSRRREIPRRRRRLRMPGRARHAHRGSEARARRCARERAPGLHQRGGRADRGGAAGIGGAEPGRSPLRAAEPANRALAGVRAAPLAEC